MNPKIVALACGFAVFSSANAQEDAAAREKPLPAFVRIINASTVKLREPWRSGVDLAFKDQVLAIDIRGGETASYKKILFSGNDSVEARVTGENKVVSAVPARFEKGAFYSIFLTGLVSENGFRISPLVIRDFPVEDEKKRKGFSRVRMFNAISTFPVKFECGSVRSQTLPSNAFTDIYLPSGTHPYRLQFPFKASERDISGEFIVNSDSEFVAVVFSSPEKPDRPVLRFVNSTEARSAVTEESAPSDQAQIAP